MSEFAGGDSTPSPRWVLDATAVTAEPLGSGVLGFLDTLPTPILVSRLPDLEIVHVNGAAVEFLGRARRDLVGATVSDITSPDDRTRIAEATRRLRDGGVVLEKAYLRGDGSVVRATVQAVEPESWPGHVVSILTDTDVLHRSVRLLSLLNTISAMVPTAAGDVDAFTRLALDVITLQLDVRAQVVWYPEPVVRANDRIPAPSIDQGDERRTIRCPILSGRRELGELVVETQPGDDVELEMCLSSVANILAGAASVSQLRSAIGNGELFERGFEMSNVGMQLVSLDGVYLRVNRAFADFVGRTPEDVVGRHWSEITHPDDAHHDDRDQIFRRLMAGDRSRHQELKRYFRPDGRTVWGSIAITPVGTDPDSSEPQVMLSQVIDVTQQVDAVAALTATRDRLVRSELRYRSLVDPAPDAVFRLDAHGGIVDCNLAASRLFGLETDSGPQRRLSEILSVDDMTLRRIEALLHTVANEREPGSIDRLWLESTLNPDASGSWYQMRVLPELDQDGPVPVYVVVHDVSDSVESEVRLSTLALTDPLTGVSNRAAILDRLTHAMHRLGRTGEGIAVVALDLDHFKAVNDSFGHGLGDHALTTFAREISNQLRASDSLGRLGGDEFLIVLESVTNSADAHRIVERLIDTINPLHVNIPDAHAITLSVSAGMAFTDEAVEIDELIARADTALLEAKRRGRRRMWSAETGADHPAQGPMVSSRDLMEALDRDHFVTHYQPIVTVSGELVGAEALLRLQHPEHGLLGPGAFMQRALQTGLIGPIGYTVLDAVCDQLAEWERNGLSHLWLSVNAAPAELAHPGYREHLRAAIERTSIDPARLAIEVTEHALAGSLVSTSVISDLSALGTRIVLDDFGTGVSSLQHLRARPLHALKIDRSFISDSARDDVNRRIVEGVVALAASLDLEVVAEGVETREQLEWLSDIGCDLVQGWLFSRALPSDAFLGFAQMLDRRDG